MRKIGVRAHLSTICDYSNKSLTLNPFIVLYVVIHGYYGENVVSQHGFVGFHFSQLHGSQKMKSNDLYLASSIVKGNMFSLKKRLKLRQSYVSMWEMQQESPRQYLREKLIDNVLILYLLG